VKTRNRTDLTVESLEDRWCPAVTAAISHGVLSVLGTAATSLTVKETAPATVEIDDGATVLYGTGGTQGAAFTGVAGIKLNLTAPNTVTVDLGGNTLSRGLSAHLGNGTNALTVEDGTIAGRLSVRGGTGADVVTLGGTGTAGSTLTVAGRASVNLGGQTGDTVTVQGGTTVARNLEVSTDSFMLLSGGTVRDLEARAPSVTLSAGSTVTRDAIVSGSAGLSVSAQGQVGADLVVFGGGRMGNSAGPSSLTLGATATVGGAVAFLNARSNANPSALTTAAGSTIGGSLFYVASGQGDQVTLGGSVGTGTFGGLVDLDMRNGNNTVSVESTAVVAKRVEVEFGNGDNSLTVAGTIGQTGGTRTALRVEAGTGNNSLTVLGTAVVNGNAKVELGTGANTLDLRDAATVTGTLTADGGGNAASTFIGSTQPNHPTLAVTGFPVLKSGANP
jgi:hypothetical protein